MLVWSLSLYNTIEFKVSFFYAKSRTCSFIVINETLSAGDFVILERNDQTEHRQEAEQNIPDGGRQRHDGQLRVILGPASFFLFAWFTQDFFLLLPIARAYHLIRLSYKRNPGK